MLSPGERSKIIAIVTKLAYVEKVVLEDNKNYIDVIIPRLQ